MKLFYLSAARIPGEKANTYQILQMCDALAAQFIDVTLLYPRRTNTSAMRQIRSIRGYYGLHNVFPMTPLDVLDLISTSGRLLGRVSKIRQFVQHILFRLLMASYSRSVLRYLEHRAADVYYTRSFDVLQALIRSWPDLSQRTFYEAHDFPQSSRKQQNQAQILKQIGGVIAITKHLKELYSESGVPPEKILVAPDGVDLRRFEQINISQEEARARANLPIGDFIVGYVGRLSTLGKEKGVQSLIEAVAKAKQALPTDNLRLCCVGGPEEMIQQYQVLAKCLGLAQDELVFPGQVPPTEVPSYLQAFDLVAMPFPSTQHYAYYMSPLKLFEYMAAQRAIIATELPSLQEILQHGHNAYLVPPDDSQALAESILWLVKHPDAAQAMAKQARADVEQYTWSKRTERIVAFLNSSSRPVLQRGALV